MTRALRLLPQCLVLLAAGCSSKSSSPPPPAFGSYAPQGCAYTLTPLESRGGDYALDDPSAAGDAPLRVRIGLGGGTAWGQPGYADPTTSAVFTWETAGATRAAEIRIGTDSHAGYSWTVPQGLGDTGPSYFHEVHVCGLSPVTTYSYQVGGGGVWSASQTFATPPASGKVVVGFSGDSRDDKNVFQLVQTRMRDAGVALQLMSGDLVLLGNQEGLYAQWLDAAWKDPSDASKFLTLGQMPMLAVGGNHENQSTQYFANWALPGDGAWAETYASFDLAGAHFVLVNDEAIALGPGDETSAQLAWIDQDLAAAEANRAKAPFVVALHHRGEFSTSKHGADSDVLETRASLAPLFSKHHVDLVINGHDHDYERTKPIAPGADPKGDPVVQATGGTTYVLCAGSGASEYQPGKSAAPWRAVNVGFGKYSPAAASYLGVYGLLTIDGGKLSVKAYGLKSGGGGVAGDDVIDSLDLTR